MVAMELVKGGDANQPDADLTKALTQEAAKRGLLLLSCGVRSNVIRILAPLTIPFDHLDEGLGLLADAFEACAQ
jgi:4-aminobutyrate aminotransferase/(S)-3-amino-2-methylpropionate transaminase